MTRARRAWHWLAARPFRSSLIVITLLVVPGFVRQEQIINRLERDRQERLEDGCVRVVEGRADTRAMWLFLFQQFAGAPNVPVVAEALDRLLPALECDSDNVPVPIEG